MNGERKTKFFTPLQVVYTIAPIEYKYLRKESI